MTNSTTKRSKGLGFAIPILLFLLAELSILIDLDPRFASGWVRLFFFAVAIMALTQFAGIVLVLRGHYRLGGCLQVFASTICVFELIGILGVIGGVKAYRYGQANDQSRHAPMEAVPG